MIKPKQKKVFKAQPQQVWQFQQPNSNHVSRLSLGSSPTKKIKKYINKKTDEKTMKPKPNLKVQVLRTSTISGSSGGQIKSGTKIKQTKKKANKGKSN